MPRDKSDSKVNAANAYTKPGMRKKLFESIKASAVQGTAKGEQFVAQPKAIADKTARFRR